MRQKVELRCKGQRETKREGRVTAERRDLQQRAAKHLVALARLKEKEEEEKGYEKIEK